MGRRNLKMLELTRAFNAPIVAILVNGDAIAADEALQSVRNGGRLLVIEGCARFADELSAAVRRGHAAQLTEVSEIARSGRVALFHVDQPAETLKIQLRQMLGESKTSLVQLSERLSSLP